MSGMKTILENGARPVIAPGRLSARRVARLVDWARSFSSLTIRKCHNGLRPMCSDPHSRLCQEPDSSSIARGWKSVHPETKPGGPSTGSPRQFTPSTPASKTLRARLSSSPYPHLCDAQNKTKMKTKPETLDSSHSRGECPHEPVFAGMRDAQSLPGVATPLLELL